MLFHFVHLNYGQQACHAELLNMQAGDHTNHDYSMYFSSAGGCCDCGDPTSWKPAGFCPRHTSHTNNQHQQTLHLDTLEAMTARAVICWVVQGIAWALDDCIHPAGERAT